MATNWEDFGFGDYTALRLPTPTQMKIPQMKGIGGVVSSKNPTYEAPQVAVSNPELPEITANPAPALQVMPTPNIQLPQYQMPDTSKVTAPGAVTTTEERSSKAAEAVFPEFYRNNMTAFQPTPADAGQAQNLPLSLGGEEQSKVPVSEPIPPKPSEQSPTPMDKAMYKPVETPPPKAALPATVKNKELSLPTEWTQKDVEKASKIAEKHGLAPSQLFGIFYAETGDFRPSRVNPSTNAVGLIQLLPETGAYMLMKRAQETAVEEARKNAAANGLDPERAAAEARKANAQYGALSERDQARARAQAKEAIASMSVNDQLDLADYYIKNSARGKKGLDAIYTSIFTGNPWTKEFRKGTDAYSGNRGYDLNKDGVITREEWLNKAKTFGESVNTFKTTKEEDKKVMSKHDSAASTNEKRSTEDISKKTTLEQLRQDIMPIAKLAYPTGSKEDQKAMERIRATPIIWEDDANVLPEKTPTGGRVLGVYRTPNYEHDGVTIPLDPGAHVILKPQMGGVEDARAVLVHELVGHAGQLKVDQYDAAPIRPFPNRPDTIGPMLQGDDILDSPTPAATRIKTVAKAAELGKASLDAEQQQQVEKDFGWIQRGMMELLGLTPPKPSSALDLEMQIKSNLPRKPGTPETETDPPKPETKKPKK